MITGGSKALSSIRTLRRHNNHENTIEQYNLVGMILSDMKKKLFQRYGDGKKQN